MSEFLFESRSPLVSIIVPSYNQGAFIRETIDSCLAQDYRPLEVVVVDGASTDETLDVLHSYDGRPEVIWISEPDGGVADAVNKGLSMAHGEIAAIQSSDDVYSAGAVSTAVKSFIDNPSVSIVYGDCIKVDEDGGEVSRFVTGPFSLESFLCKCTVILQPAAFFRRTLAVEIGGWDSDFFNADTEFWLRMICVRPALKVDAFMAKRRMHRGQRDASVDSIVESYWRMMDTSPAIIQLPRRCRRAAQCGKYLHAIRYRGARGRPGPLACAWLAVMAYPEILMKRQMIPMLVPGYMKVRSYLSRLKRGIMSS